MSQEELERLLGGTERYSQLASLFQQVDGPQGPTGLSNTLIARETRRKYSILDDTLYAGFTHNVAAGEFTPDNDTIGFTVQTYPNFLLGYTIKFFWNTAAPGGKFQILNVNGFTTPQMVTVRLSTGPADPNALISTTMDTWNTPSTTRVVDIGEDWMAIGGTITGEVNSPFQVGAFALVHVAVYYYSMQK